MDGLTFRALDMTDADAVLAIQLAAEEAEPAEMFVDLNEVLENMAMPGVNLPEGTVGVMDGDLMVGYGSLYMPPPTEKWTAHVGGGVLPQFRRRGVGRAILNHSLQQAQALRDRHDPALPGELRMWLQHGRASAAGLSESAGFSTRRYFFDMHADLDGAPAVTAEGDRPLPEGIEIRPWSPDDDDSTRLAYNASFADHWGSSPMDAQRWRKSFAEAADFRPAFSRIAVRGDEVVAFVLVDEFDSETKARGYRSGYIDRVGTVRSMRGHGLAATLLRHSMEALRESGCRAAELGVDADSPTGAGRIYERLGFAVQRRNQVTALDF